MKGRRNRGTTLLPAAKRQTLDVPNAYKTSELILLFFRLRCSGAKFRFSRCLKDFQPEILLSFKDG